MNIRPLDIGFREDADRRARSLLIVAIVIAVIGSLLHRLPVTSSYRTWLLTPFAPAIAVVDGIRTALMNSVGGEDESLGRVSAETQLELSVAKEEIEALKRENNELRGLNSIHLELPFEGIVATVSGRMLSADRHILFLDVGSHDGIKKGAIVLGAENGKTSVIGKVVETSINLSKVQTILDPTTKISASLNGRGGYVFSGSTDNRSGRLNYVPREETVNVGDEIFTSEEGRLFPGGFLIGRIKAIGTRSALFHDISVEPMTSEDMIRFVWVVKEKRK